MTLNIQDKDYPQSLKNIENPPQELYTKGDYTLLNKPCIAIVGTRKPTEYGRKIANDFAKELSSRGICIVSGLAEGIDTFAHFGAKNQKGKTIAVLGSGIDEIYPESNKELANQIIEEGGCLISEYKPDEKASMGNFPIRNRIISGISMGILVVEARYRSGSGVTAKYAISQKREVFCIPRDIDQKTGYVPNELIKNGAHLVTCVDDILEYYSMDVNNEVNEEYKEVFKYINDIPKSVDEICRLSNFPITIINEKLMLMEVNGLIKNVQGGYVRI